MNATTVPFTTPNEYFAALTISDGLLFQLNDHGLGKGVTIADLSQRTYHSVDSIKEFLYWLKRARLLSRSGDKYALNGRGRQWLQYLKAEAEEAAAKAAAATQAEKWKQEYQQLPWNTHAAKDFLRDIVTLAERYLRIIAHKPSDSIAGLWIFPDNSAVVIDFPNEQLPKDPPTFGPIAKTRSRKDAA
jgi:hypothetical protein